MWTIILGIMLWLVLCGSVVVLAAWAVAPLKEKDGKVQINSSEKDPFLAMFKY
ncbi:hypothetical protein [Paenibacillus urinalis]|uniref:hypothetical protein n=1 Tax=Paenibacillus urinalis TaxID=521520 RepID=UPI0019611ABA